MIESGSAARLILSSKLNPPATSPSQVSRSKVRELVRNAQWVKLILVRAPAGFGKTTAMVQCRSQIAESGVDTAWLTLDRGDNDASRFLACLAAAVTQMTTETPAFSSDAAPGDIALGIMQQLAAHTSPFVLILDDFEHLQEPNVLELVRELIDHLPRWGQLMIGSRGLPDLGLGRLRARGQLLEIDAAHLRFSIEETTEFFAGRRNICLLDDDLSTLHRKTEGWIAALWLASMALERREGRTEFIAGFSGSNEALTDYLADDVLARQPAHLRNFLLRTSILRHLNPSLCDALLRRHDSLHMLTRLEAANLFLLPIEGQAKTYRYHSLFADFLRTQLAREMPDELLELHCAASRWYEAQGRPVPAVDHALDGCNFDHALALLAQHGEQLLEEGRMRLLTRWFAAIPETYLQHSPLLQVLQIWALCFTRGPREAMALLETSACAASPDPGVQAYVLALRPAILTMMDRNEDAYRLGTEALAQLSLAKPFADSALANQMAYLCCLMGRHQESHRLLDAARRSQGENNSFFNRMYSESVEGIIDLEEGRLRQATARFRMAVSATHAASYTHSHGNAFAGILYADSLYEVNELDKAAHLLHVYVPLAKDVGLADHMIIGYVRLARIAFCRGDIDMVFQNLTELENVGYHRQLSRVVVSAKLERARIFLLQGNEQAATEELHRADDPSVWDRVHSLRMPAHDLDYFSLGQIRWDIHFGAAAATLPRLDASIAAAATSMRHRRALKLNILKCLALKNSGDQAAALVLMRSILELAAKEGFQRILIDEGDGIGSLIHRVKDSVVVHKSDPIFNEYLHRLAQSIGTAPEDEPAPVVQDTMAQLLTPKEIRMLLLLAEGYSNIALAEKLFVSDSTVRTHLRNINTKLGAESRIQAVAIARRLGVIR
jgi:LuxR family maltose regulon positive regulatory protein